MVIASSCEPDRYNDDRDHDERNDGDHNEDDQYVHTIQAKEHLSPLDGPILTLNMALPDPRCLR